MSSSLLSDLVVKSTRFAISLLNLKRVTMHLPKTLIREATLHDLDFLDSLEAQAFPKYIRSNRRSIRLSIASPRQAVFMLEVEVNNTYVPAAACTVFSYKHSLRLYSIATLTSYRGIGLGGVLMEHLVRYAELSHHRKITLEVQSSDKRLIQWYESQGFEIQKSLPDYYAAGQDAHRMVRIIRPKEDCANLIVIDNPTAWPLMIESVKVISAKEYLSNERYESAGKFRVFNLCNSTKTHKLGYYVSLLASARDHRVSPNVDSLQAISYLSLIQCFTDDINNDIQACFKDVKTNELDLDIFFGDTPDSRYSKIAKLLSRVFDLPLFKAIFVKHDEWILKNVKTITLASALKDNKPHLIKMAESYFNAKRRTRIKSNKYLYDMAILTEPSESNAPSCPVALKKFKEAGEAIGFYVEFIDKNAYQRLNEFDALFIRSTTSVSNFTYTFSRKAFAEGLVVIDDPWSILRCSNKIYLYERLSRARIAQPKSWLLGKNKFTESVIKSLTYPIVLKQPDSAFSLGVFKVNNQAELQEKLDLMLKCSDLIIAQEFMKSNFDWRICIFDKEPLFACKYHMATDHWQIYNWSETNSDLMSGDAECVPLNQVPPHILHTAKRASACIGDGLYGVDLKDINNKAYVIEVNDNPNIDAGIEDTVIGDELYSRIMNSFMNRIERERRKD